MNEHSASMTTAATPAIAPWSALVVDDDPGIRQSLRLCLEADGARVLGVGTAVAALEALERTAYDVVLLDLWLGSESGLGVLPEMLQRQPGLGVVVVTAFASYETAVEAMRRGAADYLPKPFTPEQVRAAVERVLTRQRMRWRVAELEQELAVAEIPSWFESRAPGYRAFLERARRAAGADAVVLLRGESGTGKNVMAQWLRRHSPRANHPFVTVHCPGLSRDLMCSTLFGHKRGAFTGATADALGKVQQAEGGTLFLDEVADLSEEAQVRLLRFLNDRSYERLGDPQERHADVRVIAATNRPLERMVAEGRFREDLFYRLDVLQLELPPLRERREDLLELAEHYLACIARRHGRTGIAFSTACRAAMLAHRWPGNLRELRNAVERAVILATGEVLEPADLGLVPAPGAAVVALGAPVTLEQLEREHLARVVAAEPTLEGAARILGIDATTLARKRKRYGLA